jgi:hypothetical protein
MAAPSDAKLTINLRLARNLPLRRERISSDHDVSSLSNWPRLGRGLFFVIDTPGARS